MAIIANVKTLYTYLVFTGLAIVLTGCASSEVTNRQELAAQEQVARPGRVIV